MSDMKTKPATRAQWIKNTGLTFLCVGFALEMGAIAMGKWLLLKTGLFIFLLGIPLTIIGIFLGRRSR